MNKESNHRIGFTAAATLSIICASILSSCSESPPTNTSQKAAPTDYIQSKNGDSSIINRDISISETVTIKQVFGNGYSSSATTTNGIVGNIGGFGFNGSISSIIGNIGGFGFGGFGSFASFLAGSFPTTPPDGILLPPGSATPPPAGVLIPPFAGGTPPTAGFTPPAGGFIPPASGFTPPAAGFTPPANGFTPPAGNFTPPTGGFSNFNQLTVSQNNLSDSASSLANINIDFLFVSAQPAPIRKSGISLLAVTETTRPCAISGTQTNIVNDIDPVGLSTGDTRTNIFTDCTRANGTVVNGSNGFSTDEAIGTPFIDPTWSTQSTMFRDNFSIASPSAGTSRTTNGNTTTAISVTDNNLIIQSASGTGSQVRVDSTGETTSNHNFEMSFNWDVSAQTYSISFMADTEQTTTASSQSQVNTTIPFEGSIGSAPATGKLLFTKMLDAAAVSILTATAQPDGTVIVESDTNADGTIDSTTTEPDWSGVLFNIFNG